MLGNLFRTLYENELKRDQYLNSIPSDIRTPFFDNTLMSNLLEERDMMIKLLFGEFSESIEWFLYEWRAGFEVGMNGVNAQINNIDEYIVWMQENEGFPKD